MGRINHKDNQPEEAGTSHWAKSQHHFWKPTSSDWMAHKQTRTHRDFWLAHFASNRNCSAAHFTWVRFLQVTFLHWKACDKKNPQNILQHRIVSAGPCCEVPTVGRGTLPMLYIKLLFFQKTKILKPVPKCQSYPPQVNMQQLMRTINCIVLQVSPDTFQVGQSWRSMNMN